MKKKMPKIDKKKKAISYDPKQILKENLNIKNVCYVISIILYAWAGVKLLSLGLGMVAPLLHLFVAVIRLPDAAFTGKFLFLMVIFALDMYLLLKTIFRLALRLIFTTPDRR